MIINKNTTLFLDRDGVLNDESKKHYVTSIDEFCFLPGVLEALAMIAPIFNKIFIVTNQRVVGKQIISEMELQNIHQFMLSHIIVANGRIDKIYYCTALQDEDNSRKPNTGMALQAKSDFPEIDLVNSIMIGNNLSDMLFGKNAGMQTVFVTTTNPPFILPHQCIDFQFSNLLQAAQFMQQIK
jgi:D-glycero-D-manno-heptose 1,7-bisphosphate phosphatase